MSIQFSHCLLGLNNCKLCEIYELQKVLNQYRDFLATQLVIKMKKTIKDRYPQGEIEVFLSPSLIILTILRFLYLALWHFLNSLLGLGRIIILIKKEEGLYQLSTLHVTSKFRYIQVCLLLGNAR